MFISLSATIVKTGKTYTGWLNDIKGIIAQGESIDEVKAELLDLLRVKTEFEKRLMVEKNCSHKGLFHEELRLQIPV